jgi:hypothetical protein
MQQGVDFYLIKSLLSLSKTRYAFPPYQPGLQGYVWTLQAVASNLQCINSTVHYVTLYSDCEYLLYDFRI